jgi:radical SAM superfamily enzyme YgiQ (UPF0313 family)
MFSFVRLWASWIKEKYDNTIIVGGVHPTLNPEATINNANIDAVCVGEGEAPLVEMLNGIQHGEDVSQIQSLWVKKDRKVYKNPPRPTLKDLDSLPFPDRGIFDYRNLDREREGIGVFMASRGCPYNCYYCCNHAIKECTGGANGYVRFRSVDNVLEEIKQTVKDYPSIHCLHFDDDILPMKRKWFAEFSTRYSKEIGLPFECNVRPNLLDKTTIELLRHAGCKTLQVGLESGNSFIRNEILNRNITEDTLIHAASLCKEAGIRLFTFNMVGLPLEDMPARLDTVKFNAKIDSNEEQVSIFYPFEKTRLFDICSEQGLLQNREVTDLFKETSISFKKIEQNQILFTAYYFTLLVRLYRFFMRLPVSASKKAMRFSDAILCLQFTAWIIYPPLIVFRRFLGRHKSFETWARKLKHAIQKKGEQ